MPTQNTGIGQFNPFQVQALPNNGGGAPAQTTASTAPANTTPAVVNPPVNLPKPTPTGTTSPIVGPKAGDTAMTATPAPVNPVVNLPKPTPTGPTSPIVIGPQAGAKAMNAMKQGVTDMTNSQNAAAQQGQQNNQQTTLAQDQARAANQGKPGFDVFGDPVVQPGTTPGQATAADQPPAPLDSVQQAIQQQQQLESGLMKDPTYAAAEAAKQSATNNLNIVSQRALDTINSLQSNTFNASQQADLTRLAQQQKDALSLMERAIQGDVNNSAAAGGSHGGVNVQYTSNKISASMADGAERLTRLADDQSAAMRQLTAAFQSDNAKALSTAYDNYYKVQDKISAAASETEKNIRSEVSTFQQQQFSTQQAEATRQAEQIKSIQNLGAEVLKSSGNAALAQQVASATTVDQAIGLAGDSLHTATGKLGEFLGYQQQTKSEGLTPLGYDAWTAKQNADAIKQKSAEAYSSAYASASAKSQFDNSPANQQKLEQQYRQVLTKEFSSRSGALGVENAKVNQGNHLNALISKYYDPKTGNYNIPNAQYTELAMGLANMISPTGNSSEADRAEIKSSTAKGDFNGAISYITGTPQTGNTQAIIKNLVDSIDRQASQATQNRQAALENMKAMAPTDLNQNRVDQLNKATNMVGYAGQERVSKEAVNEFVTANPDQKETIAKLFEVPGANNEKVHQYLISKGVMQQ